MKAKLNLASSDGVDEIAVQQHGHADADRHAIDRGHNRRLRPGDRLDEARGRIGAGVSQEGVQVVAGAEAVAAAGT